MVRWLGSLVGFCGNASGLLTSGGSMANFTALFVAHRAKSETGSENRRSELLARSAERVCGIRVCP